MKLEILYLLQNFFLIFFDFRSDTESSGTLAIKLWNMIYLLFKHFDPFLNLFPSLYVPSIRKKQRRSYTVHISIFLIHKKNIPIIF